MVGVERPLRWPTQSIWPSLTNLPCEKSSPTEYMERQCPPSLKAREGCSPINRSMCSPAKSGRVGASREFSPELIHLLMRRRLPEMFSAAKSLTELIVHHAMAHKAKAAQKAARSP